MCLQTLATQDEPEIDKVGQGAAGVKAVAMQHAERLTPAAPGGPGLDSEGRGKGKLKKSYRRLRFPGRPFTRISTRRDLGIRRSRCSLTRSSLEGFHI